MPPLDTFLDRLSAAGWSYGITVYVDEDGQPWTQVDARRDHKGGVSNRPFEGKK